MLRTCPLILLNRNSIGAYYFPLHVWLALSLSVPFSLRKMSRWPWVSPFLVFSLFYSSLTIQIQIYMLEYIHVLTELVILFVPFAGISTRQNRAYSVVGLHFGMAYPWRMNHFLNPSHAFLSFPQIVLFSSLLKKPHSNSVSLWVN